MITDTIAVLLEGTDLSMSQAADTMREIMSGETTDAQIAGFLIALRLKGETAQEIAGCARIMREKATPIRTEASNVIDTCGTGGDRSGTFNISTAAALVAAAAGATVAKHGNRSVSSSSGSADVMKTLGVNIELSPERVGQCLDSVGIAFLFAPKLHAAMKYAIGPRRELGVRTIFNILGPLTNPAGARRQLMGVYSPELVELVGGALRDLGTEKALVVHGRDGLDEISTCDITTVCEVTGDAVKMYDLDASELGLPRATHDALAAGGAEESAAIVKSVLAGQQGPPRDIVALNAAAALDTSGIASDLADGVAKACDAIDSGKAADVLAKLVEETHR